MSHCSHKGGLSIFGEPSCVLQVWQADELLGYLQEKKKKPKKNKGVKRRLRNEKWHAERYGTSLGASSSADGGLAKNLKLLILFVCWWV